MEKVDVPSAATRPIVALKGLGRKDPGTPWSRGRVRFARRACQMGMASRQRLRLCSHVWTAESSHTLESGQEKPNPTQVQGCLMRRPQRSASLWGG